MRGLDDPVLECQTCGDVVRRLTLEEQQKVARDPQNFIIFCGPCGREEMAQMQREEFLS